MADFRAHVEGLPAFTARMQRAPQVIREELTRAVDRCTTEGVKGSKAVVPVVTGHLRRSIHNERATFAGGTARGMWGTNVPYAKYVEFGRGPIQAPPRSVLAFRIKGRGPVIFRPRVGPARPRPFLFNTAQRLRGAFNAEFAACSRRIVARLSGGAR